VVSDHRRRGSSTTSSEDNIIGIGLANSAFFDDLSKPNPEHNNPGAASGTGIYTDQYVTRRHPNYLIEQNAFKGNVDAGIDVSNVDPRTRSLTSTYRRTPSTETAARCPLQHRYVDHSQTTITNCTLAGAAPFAVGTWMISRSQNDLNTGELGHPMRISSTRRHSELGRRDHLKTSTASQMEDYSSDGTSVPVDADATGGASLRSVPVGTGEESVGC